MSKALSVERRMSAISLKTMRSGASEKILRYLKSILESVNSLRLSAPRRFERCRNPPHTQAQFPLQNKVLTSHNHMLEHLDTYP